MKRKEVLTLEKRIAIFISVLLVAVLILIIRIAWIQFVDGKSMTARANTQLRESKMLHSPRGTIYDRNGQELAVSGMTKSLYANPSEIKDADNIALSLSNLLGMKPEDMAWNSFGKGPMFCPPRSQRVAPRKTSIPARVTMKLGMRQ